MKKKLVSLLLTATMVVTSLAGCVGSSGTKNNENAGDASELTEEDATIQEVVEPSTMVAPDVSDWDSSKEIYVYSWNDELPSRLAYIIGPKDADGNKLVKGDAAKQVGEGTHPELAPFVHVINLKVSGVEDPYKEAIRDAAVSDKYPSIIPADNDVVKYFMEDDDFTMSLYDAGITDSMYEDAYDYTKDYGRYNGELKALCWQATPGCVVYRASIAKEVLGTDEPTEVAEYLKDWDTWFDTAQKMKDAGYKMVSDNNEAKYAILDQKTQPWIRMADDGSETLQLDETAYEYIESAKKIYDAGFSNNTTSWTDDWYADFNGDVFSYFGCPWFVYWCISCKEGDPGYGDWRVCSGPVEYHWGGTYVSIGKDTPNPELAAFLLYSLCCDEELMYTIEKNTKDFVNNKKAVKRIIADGEGAADLIGGQNPVETWDAQTANIRIVNATYLDAAINNYIDDAIDLYIEGKVKNADEAIQYVKDEIEKAYDNITVE